MNSAFVRANLTCPHCAVLVEDSASFQWGYCPHADPSFKDGWYTPGEPIRWWRCTDGRLPAWTYFHQLRRAPRANFGDPTVRDVIALNTWQRPTDEPNGAARRPTPCAQCGGPLGGTAVEVRNGIIRRVWIYRPDEFVPDLWLYFPDPAGRGPPTLAWNDHAMAVVEDCNSGAAVVPYL